MDNFKRHSMDIVKNYVKSFKSSDNDNNNEDQYELIDFHIIGSSIIIPKVQPLDLFLGKIMKEFHRDLYNICMINVPIDLTTGHLFIPSH